MCREVQELWMIKRKNDQTRVFLNKNLCNLAKTKILYRQIQSAMTVVTKHAALQEEVMRLVNELSVRCDV